MRSRRRLAAECHRNLEVRWRVRELQPDCKTSADCRKDHAAACKAVVRECTRLCRQLERCGGQLLASDGTKIKASHAADRNWSQARLEACLQALESAAAAAELQGKIARLTERKTEIQARLATRKQTGATQLSATAPDSRGMKSPHGHLAGHNVPGSVAAKPHLRVTAAGPRSAADPGPLAEVAQAAQAELEIPPADVVAAGG